MPAKKKVGRPRKPPTRIFSTRLTLLQISKLERIAARESQSINQLLKTMINKLR